MRRLALLCALLACSCAEESSSVVIQLSSDLEIGVEANVLVARVMSGGTALAEESYLLGEPPLDKWPQTLPIISMNTSDSTIRVEAELRLSLAGMPSVAVGFGQAQAELQPGGDMKVVLFVDRNCDDLDGDGFGIGFGCVMPDCDDNDPRVPREEFCPDPVVADAGVDAGESDTGVADAGPTDADRPDAPAPDAAIDAGFDAGVPDIGGEACGQEVCEADERCASGRCRKECQTTPDCGSVYLSCLESFNICICRVPCADPATDMCGPLACVDGCCPF